MPLTRNAKAIMMIKRIVKMTFQPDQVPVFLDIFETSKNLIRQFPGCQHVELLRLSVANNVFFTFSLWENEQALEAYRQSALFRTTWSKTKVLFADKPEAWSLELVSSPDVQ